MAGFRLAWLLISGLLSGCLPERHSGTEVGNPDIMVSARFGFIGDDSLAVISSMEMMVMKMEYRLSDDSLGSFWNYPSGMAVDLASPATAANLPAMRMDEADWASAELMLAARQGDSSLPDSIPYAAYSNPRFIKLVKRMGGDSARFLFELPDGMQLKLRFDSERMTGWKTENRLSIEVIFDCARWTSAISAQPYRDRMDGEGKPYVLVSPGENADLHAVLEALLPECFLADGAEFM